MERGNTDCWLQLPVSSSILAEMRKRWTVRKTLFSSLWSYNIAWLDNLIHCQNLAQFSFFSSLWSQISHFNIENANNFNLCFKKLHSYITETILCTPLYYAQYVSSYQFLAKLTVRWYRPPPWLNSPYGCRFICFVFRGITLLLGRFF